MMILSSSHVIARNNLVSDFSLAGNNLLTDHKLELVCANAGALFVAPPYGSHPLRAAAALLHLCLVVLVVG